MYRGRRRSVLHILHVLHRGNRENSNLAGQLRTPRRYHTGKDSAPVKPKPAQNVRPGQRHPYTKGNKAQIGQRRAFVRRLLSEGAYKMEIHRAVLEQFNIQWRQCDRYIQAVTANEPLDTYLSRPCACKPC